jgi:hypothetical protein
MKPPPKQKTENAHNEIAGIQPIPLHRAKDIMKEEGIKYSDEELSEVLQFISKVISITTSHYERRKERQAKVISINTNRTHEKESILIHPSKYRRAG